MSLRPRYSLLALLLFTALVAGGVKLWRGPHHVVDRSNPQMEDEYTYYRDWDGTKIMDGVRVRRYEASKSDSLNVSPYSHLDGDPTDQRFKNHPATATIEFDYYRHGKRMNIQQRIISIPREYGPYEKYKEPWYLIDVDSQLNNCELEAFNEAVQKESKHYEELGGFVFEQYELIQ